MCDKNLIEDEFKRIAGEKSKNHTGKTIGNFVFENDFLYCAILFRAFGLSIA